MLQTSRIVDLYSKMESLLYTMPLPGRIFTKSNVCPEAQMQIKLIRVKILSLKFIMGSEIMAYNDPVE